MKLAPSPSCIASTHQRCQRKLCRRRVPKIRDSDGPLLVLEDPQPLDFRPEFGFGPGVEHVEIESAHAAHRRPRPQFADNGEGGDLPHRRSGPKAVEAQLILTVALRQFIVGETESSEPLHELRLENVARAVERIAGEPNQLVLGESQGARVIELVDQLALVHDIGEPHRRCSVDELESDPALRMHLPDHLEHQKLVEIRVEQRSHRRIDPKRVIIDAGCDIRGHYASLRTRRLSDKSAAPSLGQGSMNE